jgi:hypothetical protein
MAKIVAREELDGIILAVISGEGNPFKGTPFEPHVEPGYWLVQASIQPNHPFLTRRAYQYKMIRTKPSWRPEFSAQCSDLLFFANGDESILEVQHKQLRELDTCCDIVTIELESPSEQRRYEIALPLEHDKPLHEDSVLTH